MKGSGAKRLGFDVVLAREMGWRYLTSTELQLRGEAEVRRCRRFEDLALLSFGSNQTSVVFLPPLPKRESDRITDQQAPALWAQQQ